MSQAAKSFIITHESRFTSRLLCTVQCFFSRTDNRFAKKSHHTLSPSFLFGKLRPSLARHHHRPPHARRQSPATTPPSSTERLSLPRLGLA